MPKRLKISITDKFLLFFVPFNLCAVMIASIALYYSAKDAIVNRTFDQLTSVRVVKTRQIESFFSETISRIQTIENLIAFKFQKIENQDVGKRHSKILATEQLIYAIKKDDNIEGFAIVDIKKKTVLAKFFKDSAHISFSRQMLNLNFITQNNHFELNDFFKDLSTGKPLLTIVSNSEQKDSIAICYFISCENINEIMLEQKASEGLGQSGESYIVGSDSVMRSQSRFIDNSILLTKVRTESIKRALSGKSETIIANDYRGIKVLSSFAPLSIDGLNWVLLAEIDYDEALSPVNELRIKIIIISISFSILLFILTYIISKNLTKPLLRLTKAISILPDNKFSPLPVEGNNEISELTVTFNQMASDLQRNKEELRIERLKRFASVIDAQEKEREKLSAEIHDGVGQMLVALKLRLESINSGNVSNAAKIKSAKQIIDDIIDDIRRITNNLLPPALSEFGIESAIGNLCNTLAELTDINFSYINNLEQKLSDKTMNISIYRIVQEALNNAVKHSNANNISVSLASDGNAITLVILDDGCGFDMSKVNIKNSNGLYNINERTLALRGNATVESSIGKGTKISINIPVNYGTGQQN